MTDFERHDLHDYSDEPMDALEILASHDLEPTVVELMTRFGGETAETAYVERVFSLDLDCQLIWDTQLVGNPLYPGDPEALHALMFGLMTIFADPSQWAEDESAGTWEDAVRRWRIATRTLLRLGDQVGARGPWLYGWAIYGADLFAMGPDPRLELQAFDEFPQGLDELMTMPGVGAVTALKIQHELISVLLDAPVELV